MVENAQLLPGVPGLLNIFGAALSPDEAIRWAIALQVVRLAADNRRRATGSAPRRLPVILNFGLSGERWHSFGFFAVNCPFFSKSTSIIHEQIPGFLLLVVNRIEWGRSAKKETIR
ncbi:MAG: hypothetical protein H7Z75_01875 [Ferruginibacter sp.]|nr:hypothetical protein [Cytophagales bacterium]